MVKHKRPTWIVETPEEADLFIETYGLPCAIWPRFGIGVRAQIAYDAEVMRAFVEAALKASLTHQIIIERPPA